MGRRGFTLLEVMFAGAILAIVSVTAFAAMIHAVRISEENTLRASALHVAERTIEELRALGAKQIQPLMAFGALEQAGFKGVWGADGVALGLTQGRQTVTKTYRKGPVGSAWQELGTQRNTLDQAVFLVTLGEPTNMAENVVRVYVDLHWTVASRSFHESIFAVID
jgi:prepilin-type N-terminal cleavage/methylation domain-containing protein